MVLQQNREDANPMPDDVLSSNPDETVRPVKPQFAPIAPKNAKPSRLRQWFLDLPLGRKQLLALIGSEVITLGLISFGGLYVISESLQKELASKAISENAVTQINYNLKINQMGFGFRGQADNLAIISAAREYAKTKVVPPELRAQVRKILRNEIDARVIEYATLVAPDGKIIINAQDNRAGEMFDPEGLVSAIVKDGGKDSRQIKASAIVNLDELKKEGAPLPEGLTGPDALIRYTATPVRDGNAIIGVLVSGDIVNGKTPIVRNTLRALGDGYSAVYYRDRKGEFQIATTLAKSEGDSLDAAKSGVALSDPSVLKEVLEAGGKPIIKRMQIGNETYTVSMKTEPSLFREDKGGPVAIPNGLPPAAILIRGTSEAAQNELINYIRLELLVVIIIAITIISLWSLLLRSAVTRRIERLRSTTAKFAEGERTTRAEVIAVDEIGQLASTFNMMAENINAFEFSLRAEAQRSRVLADISRATSEEELANPLAILLGEIRTQLECDRVVLYRINAFSKGSIVGESVAEDLTSAFDMGLNDPCIPESLIEAYEQGRIVPVSDIEQGKYDPAHLNLLKQLQVKANLVVPVVRSGLLSGELDSLLISHHCFKTHIWEESEIDLMKFYGERLAQALSGLANLEQQQENARREKERNLAIQQELITLLTEVEGAASGDLTVRAQITAGEIGIVADFFNAIIENLRDVVTQVKKATIQVNTSVTTNDQEIRRLTEEAMLQAEQIETTLESVEQVTGSIQQVALRAQEAANASLTAENTAEQGGAAISRTVDSINQLRETVAETAKKVKRLGESSQQISRVVALIDQIALKTNMLAVNASIEAARAGEEGRGFAVVAEEVGALAAQSANATKEIERIVSSIQQETGEVVAAMETSTLQVVEGTKQVEEARHSLAQIVSVSRQANQLFQAIAAATTDQVQTSEIVRQLMEQVAAISRQSSVTSRDVSAALQETVQVAEQLQDSVSTFKI
ncbi:MAG: methyl-accepting chemotaxis protein [Pseudanabaenaceae cyanobacterium]|jgi:twitching motility protein PilJ